MKKSMINKAIELSAKAHDGQLDKSNEPYIFHVLRVMLNLNTEDEQIVGVLHDTIEDTNVTLQTLKEMGFGENIIEAIDYMSRREEEPYEDFIDRILENKLASIVKIKDLEDNMDISRIKNPEAKDFVRMKKYKNAKEKILSKFKNEDIW